MLRGRTPKLPSQRPSPSGTSPAEILDQGMEPLASVAIDTRAMEVAMQWNWRELVALSLFVALFCAALIANVRDVSPSRGAWVTQAMR
jgi:hypothetical protein